MDRVACGRTRCLLIWIGRDGIAYASRHDPEQVCIALFSRPDIALQVLSGPTPLADMLAEVANLMRRHAKGIG